MKNIKIGNKLIGANQPTFIIAEIGINHNGNMSLAKEMIFAAKAAGADAVKFQNYKTEDFILDKTLDYTYRSSEGSVTESQYEMFKRCELNMENLIELKEYSDRIDIVFFSTPTSKVGLDELISINVPILKNGSDFLVNLDLISEMGHTGVPTILSCGMATLSEIDEAVRVFYESGGSDIILMHCTSSYPAPFNDINLKRIPVLNEIFCCPVGLSDHSEGVSCAIGAVALGARVIEKHFTTDKSLPGPDHWFSSDFDEMKLLVDSIREIEAALGSPVIRITDSERYGRTFFRLSCVAQNDLQAGHVIEDSDICYRRPGSGFPPKAKEWIIGQKLVRAITRGSQFTKKDFLNE